MAREGEGKKGRVICAWCGKDLREAETELDSHECCLPCLKLALREVDERLSAFGQGQEAGQRASRYVERKVKRVWRVGERPVNLSVLYGPLGMVGTRFRCPGCERDVEVEDSGEELSSHCDCGAHLRRTAGPGLAEREVEEVSAPPGRPSDGGRGPGCVP